MTVSSLVPRATFDRTVSHFDQTRGWLSHDAAQIFFLLHALQRQAFELSGDILEIGAHEGRSSIFFSHLLGEGENLEVSDIFDSQDLNLSRSGGSSFRTWETNFRKLRARGASVAVHQGLSQQLDAETLGRRFRIAYLDGGHATEEVRADLWLADRILLPAGIAVLDDTFSEDFPGTTEGLILYGTEAGSRLVPLLVFESKVGLVDRNHYDEYRNLLTKYLDQDEHIYLPLQTLCGTEVLILRFQGKWERRSKQMKARFPALHRTLGATSASRNAFHRLRGGLSDRAK